MTHPYRSQPDRAFWSRAVSDNFDARFVASFDAPLLRQGDRVVSAGSCFAANMVPWLEAAGLTYVREDQPHLAFAHLPENLGYRSFSAAYGNIYTARHLRQLMERVMGTFHPAEDRWHEREFVIDPFRPGLAYPARSDRELDLLTAQHLEAVHRAFIGATVFVFTLGLTEAWESCIDGAVYPGCPGTIAGTFDPDKHRFHNFNVGEIVEDMRGFIGQLREINPDVRIILTVSPVPLVATATNQHVLSATTYSKSVLRVAAAEVVAGLDAADYFPAYEIVTGPQAPAEYFADDKRNVTDAGVTAVMNALIAASDLGDVDVGGAPVSDAPVSDAPVAHSEAADMSRRIIEAECDEMLQEG